jgi:hypothetical protein
MRIAILTNAPAPYRTPVFERIAEAPGVEARVFFDSASGAAEERHVGRPRRAGRHGFLFGASPDGRFGEAARRSRAALTVGRRLLTAAEHRNDRKTPPGLVRVRCLPGAAEMSSREEIKLLKKRLPPRNWLRIWWAHSGASDLAIGRSRAWESPNPKSMR